MNSTKKTTLRIAAILLAVGLAVLAIGYLTGGAAFFTGSDGQYTEKTYTVDEAFHRIRIDGVSERICLVRQPGICRVDCMETQHLRYQVAVEDDTLTVKLLDTQKWYESVGFGFSFGNWGERTLTVYLPEGSYEALTISTTSGSVEIPGEFAFRDAEVDIVSGSIRFAAGVESALTLSTVSGSISVEQASPQRLIARSTSGSVKLSSVTAESLRAETISGAVSLSQLRCEELSCETTSGGIRLEQVTGGRIQCSSTSGSIRLDGCDGDSLRLETTSGSIRGTLRSEKIFFTKSVSGTVDVPRTVSGGTCEAETTSGSIHLTIEEAGT